MMYAYKASDSKNGKSVKGFIEAQNPTEAASFLRDKSLVPIAITKHEGKTTISDILPFLRGHSGNDLIIFTRQLSSMLSSGLTLMQSMMILKEQMQKPAMKDMVN